MNGENISQRMVPWLLMRAAEHGLRGSTLLVWLAHLFLCEKSERSVSCHASHEDAGQRRPRGAPGSGGL